MKVYVVSKILRKCTSTDITSFKAKYAHYGQSLQRVMKYWTLTGKFTGVHPELAKIGVTEVKVTDQGLEFHGDVKQQNS